MKRIQLLLVTLALSGCDTPPSQLTVVKIATISPLSGNQSGMGLGIKNAAQLAVNEMQAEFAQAGLTLNLVAYDDQADPATGTAAARRVIADKAILGVIGTLNSGVMIPTSAAASSSHLVFVSPSTTHPNVTDRGLMNVNRVIARQDSEGTAGANFIADTLKARSVYVLSQDTPDSQDLVNEAEGQLRARGLTVMQRESVAAVERDFSAIITKIQALKPEAVYFGATPEQAGAFVKQVRDKGLTLPIVGGSGFDSDDFSQLAGRNVSEVYFTTSVPRMDALPNAQATAAAFQAAFNASMDGLGALSYDATKILLQSILNAAKANGNTVPAREQVQTTLRNGTYSGLLTGDVTFNSKGDRTPGKVYLVALKNGERRTVGTLHVNPK